MMRRLVVAGNWKMNGNGESIDRLLSGIIRGLSSARSAPTQPDQKSQPSNGSDGVELMVFPPGVYLSQTVRRLAGMEISVGAQNIHQALEGAYTGEISAEMVADVGATQVLVGHSERRHLFAEDDATVAEKFMAAQRAGLRPLLCLGETRAERASGLAQEVVLKQLDAVIRCAGVGALASAMLAYEPVWAIGTGLTASAEDAQQMHAGIRSHVAATAAELAATLPILYGGSVNPDNAAGLFAGEDVDGGLIGGAALKAAAFMEIWAAAEAQMAVSGCRLRENDLSGK